MKVMTYDEEFIVPGLNITLLLLSWSPNLDQSTDPMKMYFTPAYKVLGLRQLERLFSLPN